VQNSVSWGMTGGWVVGYALRAWGDAIQLLLVDHLIVWWDVVDVVDVVERAGESLFYLRMDSLCRACMGGVVLEHAQIVVK
jgi:hypothetical protein